NDRSWPLTRSLTIASSPIEPWDILRDRPDERARPAIPVRGSGGPEPPWTATLFLGVAQRQQTCCPPRARRCPQFTPARRPRLRRLAEHQGIRAASPG